MEKNFLLVRRIMAKLIDYSLVLAIMKLVTLYTKHSNFIVAFLLYSLVVYVLQGRTFGKYICQLELQGGGKSFWRVINLCIREVIIFLTFPFIMLTILVSDSPLFHDRLFQTEVRD